MLAVDLPLVPAALLSLLVDAAADADVAAPFAEGYAQPLCAAYRRSTCTRPVRRALASGRFKMTHFWQDVRVREVRAEELVPFGAPADLLRNLNTPEDYELALRGAR
jgi:molybdopterin-guanine dinucleotide biosynthesis protein A